MLKTHGTRLKSFLCKVADSHAPRIRVRVRGQKSREVNQLMIETDHFHKLALRTNNELHWSSYKRYVLL